MFTYLICFLSFLLSPAVSIPTAFSCTSLEPFNEGTNACSAECHCIGPAPAPSLSCFLCLTPCWCRAWPLPYLNFREEWVLIKATWLFTSSFRATLDFDLNSFHEHNGELWSLNFTRLHQANRPSSAMYKVSNIQAVLASIEYWWLVGDWCNLLLTYVLSESCTIIVIIL